MALLTVHHYSSVLDMPMDARVILPEKPHIDRAHPARVLYLLHGMGGDHTVWTRRTSIERYADACDLAVVMPETHLGWYTDMANGYRYYTYMTEELPVMIRRMFPSFSTKREDTYAAGLSMGGYGALKLALKAPHLFGRAASLSGAVDIAALYDSGNGAYWADVFGPRDKAGGSENDLFRLAADLPPAQRPPLWLWCGTEDFLYQHNLRFKRHLETLGYDFRFGEGPGGHTWDRWDEMIQPALRWLTEGKQHGVD